MFTSLIFVYLIVPRFSVRSALFVVVCLIPAKNNKYTVTGETYIEYVEVGT